MIDFECVYILTLSPLWCPWCMKTAWIAEKTFLYLAFLLMDIHKKGDSETFFVFYLNTYITLVNFKIRCKKCNMIVNQIYLHPFLTEADFRMAVKLQLIYTMNTSFYQKGCKNFQGHKERSYFLGSFIKYVDKQGGRVSHMSTIQHI